MKDNNNFQIQNNFNLREFMCPCCETVKISRALVDMLQDIRDYFMEPVIITSGYRCYVNNKKINGAPGSYHLQGLAADFYVHGVNIIDVYSYILELDLPGIGKYTNYIHIDLGVNNRRW